MNEQNDERKVSSHLSKVQKQNSWHQSNNFDKHGSDKEIMEAMIYNNHRQEGKYHFSTEDIRNDYPSYVKSHTNMNEFN